jgi:hypothetical protein
MAAKVNFILFLALLVLCARAGEDCDRHSREASRFGVAWKLG